MPGIYEDVPIGDMSYDADERLYQYQCPCGDLFEITLEELWDGDDVAHCPSCTLKVRVIFDKEQLPPLPTSTSTSSPVTRSAMIFVSVFLLIGSPVVRSIFGASFFGVITCSCAA